MSLMISEFGRVSSHDVKVGEEILSFRFPDPQ